MSRQTRYLDGLLFCLGCTLGSCASAQPAATVSAPTAVHTQETLRATLASGKPTPLDALTPYGKREALRQMRWSGNTSVGFGYAPLIRELDHEQLAAVLRFLDAYDYLPVLDKKLVGPPLRLPAPSAQIEQDLQLLRQFADEDNSRRAEATAPATEVGAAGVLRRYQQLFGSRFNSETLTTQPPGDLLALFDAAGLAATGNPASLALDHMLRLHGEFTARGIDTRRALDDRVLYEMLAARRFEQARSFAAIRPHLAAMPIPQIVDRLGPGFKGRSVFEYDAQRNTLSRLAVPYPSGMELVMVVGEGCHNSSNALQAIHADATLQARLRSVNLLIVTTPHAPIETHLMAEWNAVNPAMPIRAPYSVQEWQSIEVTGIPSFYLLRNGKVVDQRVGWPAEQQAELIRMIDAAEK